MSSKPDGGLKDALQLDQAASDLSEARAAAVETEADRQAELFPGASVFGRVRNADGSDHAPRGPGRPRGSLSRRTRDIADYAAKLGGNPVLRLIEIVATPIDVIAATLGCKKIEAADFWRKCAADLAPYVEQKLPTAVQVQGPNAGMLVINLGGAGSSGQPVGLDMRVVDVIRANEAEAARLIDHEENQALSDGDDEPSHDGPSHDGGK